MKMLKAYSVKPNDSGLYSYYGYSSKPMFSDKASYYKDIDADTDRAVNKSHIGLSGLHTSNPEYSLYDENDMFNRFKETLNFDNDDALIANERLLKANPKWEKDHDSLYNQLYSNLYKEEGVDLDEDIYNLPENRDFEKTGNLYIPRNLMLKVHRALNKVKPDSKQFHLPLDYTDYYTNGKQFAHNKALLDKLWHLDKDFDPEYSSGNATEFWLADVDPIKSSEYSKSDYPEEMLAWSVTPKKGISSKEFNKQYSDYYMKSKDNPEDEDKYAADVLHDAFDIDPVELSDERMKDVKDDMNDTITSDLLKAVYKTHGKKKTAGLIDACSRGL